MNMFITAQGYAKFGMITVLIGAVVRKFVLLIPMIYLMPMIMENKTYSVYYAEPVADFLAVTFTSVLFFVQFRKALRGIAE